MSPARVAILAGVLMGAAVSLPVEADELEMRSVSEAPPNSPEGVPRPTRGMSMDAVRQRFGEPERVVPAVGEPPITRWVYDRYTVYFEHEYAIHSVVHPESE